MLLCCCPEATTSVKRRVHQQLKVLLEAAAAQQAESSASRQRSERHRGAAPSAHRLNPPPPDIRIAEMGPRLQHRRSIAISGPTAMLGTPSKLTDGLRASTTTTTVTTATAATSIAHIGMTTRDADDATTATTTATVAGCRTRGDHELSDKAYGTRGSPRISELRPTSPGTTGTRTPTCGWRTTGSRATRGSDRRPLHHQEPAALLR
jgi:hypothetical protein